MTHRRITSLILVSIILLSTIGIGAWSGEERIPVVLVMPGGVGEASAPSDLDVVSMVSTYMADTGKLDVISFDPENPTIARFILERKMGDDYLSKIIDPKITKEIAGLLKADYILTVHGDVRPTVVLVALRMVKTSGKGEWTSGAESAIASGTGPQATVNRLNAISTAASSAVSQIDIAAFGKLKTKPKVDVVDTTTSSATPAAVTNVATPAEEQAARDLVAEFTSHMNAAERYAANKDLPNVIYELRQAVNTEPKTISVRMKLAEAYSALGMTEEAVDELKRTLLFKPDDAAVYHALGQFYLSNGALREAGDHFQEAVKLDPANVGARISLGNILWNQNKLDEAAAMFEEAVKLDPANAVPHERLYKLNWARKNFALAIGHLVASKSAGKEMDADARYKIAAGVIHSQLGDILGKLDETWKEYGSQQLGREDYYRECGSVSARIDELASFLSTQTAPDGLKAAHSHGVLCASLLSQSAGSLISYLETDKKQYSEQAAMFRQEAKTELDEFGKAIGE